ncbi:MAG TPA: hypothetical protein VFP93_05210, partial [Gammaproteobacteria bacterium]|nr:hypothetical protein [Gammaproteobacteria bacterium]
IEIPSKRSIESSMIYVIVANVAHIQNILEITKNADLKVSVIDIPELALLNVFESLPSPNKTRVFISFQNDATQLIIFKNKKLLFMRRLDLVYQKSQNLEKILNDVALQVQRSLDYCSSNIMDVSSATIYLDLNEPNPDLPEKLSAILGLRVVYFDIKELLDIEYSEKIPHNYTSLASVGGILRANVI